MSPVIRIGSRQSRLAVMQAEIVKRQIERLHPQVKVEIITMKTTGDKILDRSLETIGGKGLFVKELDRALLNGEIDISVHSLKDMPMETDERLPILAYTKREDPRDVLIVKTGKTEEEARKTGAVIWPYLEGLDDPEAKTAALAERAFVKALDGGCTSPVAAYAQIKGTTLKLRGLYYEEGAQQYIVDTIVGEAEEAEALGEYLAIKMKEEA